MNSNSVILYDLPDDITRKYVSGNYQRNLNGTYTKTSEFYWASCFYNPVNEFYIYKSSSNSDEIWNIGEASQKSINNISPDSNRKGYIYTDGSDLTMWQVVTWTDRNRWTNSIRAVVSADVTLSVVDSSGVAMTEKQCNEVNLVNYVVITNVSESNYQLIKSYVDATTPAVFINQGAEVRGKVVAINRYSTNTIKVAVQQYGGSFSSGVTLLQNQSNCVYQEPLGQTINVGGGCYVDDSGSPGTVIVSLLILANQSYCVVKE